jgi:hypothetical protein
VTAEAVHGGFSRKTGPRARLVESREEGLVLEQVPVAPFGRERLQPVGYREDLEVLLSLHVLQGQDVSTEETPHVAIPFHFVDRRPLARL